MTKHTQFGHLDVGQLFRRPSRNGVWRKLERTREELEGHGGKILAIRHINCERLDETSYVTDELFDETLIVPLTNQEAWEYLLQHPRFRDR